MKIAIGIFLILHGLVHLLYFGHSMRFYEMQPGMTWPDSSWAFSRLLGVQSNRIFASVLLALGALSFAVGGIAILTSQPWGQGLAIGAALFSSLIFLLFWDGSVQHLDQKGAVGILINLAVIVAAYIFLI